MAKSKGYWVLGAGYRVRGMGLYLRGVKLSAAALCHMPAPFAAFKVFNKVEKNG